MRKFKATWSLLVLALLVFMFSCGCGGSGSSVSDNSSDAPAWDTDPTPTPAPELTPAPTPEPSPTPDLTPAPAPETDPTPTPTPEPEPTPTPTPEPTPAPAPDNGNNTYSDTYNIASVLNGNWYGVSGSGTATGADGTFNVIMSNMSLTVARTQINGNTGTAYFTYRQRWNTEDEDDYYYYHHTTLLYGDNEFANLQHVGSDTWKCTFSDGTVAVITFTSETTAMVTQDGTANIDGVPYRYSVRYTLRKGY